MITISDFLKEKGIKALNYISYIMNKLL